MVLPVDRNLNDDITSALVGIRYLSSAELTSIIEYYHNGGGYSANETALFHDLVDNAAAESLNSGENDLQGGITGSSGYIRPYAGRSYLYARFSRKDPFDILYFTPAVTTIVNLDDDSFTLTPEFIYTGYTNWKIRLRCAVLEGDSGSDFGEKQNSSRIELRLRYFF